jgi:hypothetical protein
MNRYGGVFFVFFLTLALGVSSSKRTLGHLVSAREIYESSFFVISYKPIEVRVRAAFLERNRLPSEPE